MKPVSVTGVFDHSKEIQVDKVQNSEKGALVITPFYTHMKNGEKQAILVNRGWVPQDLRHHRMHYLTASEGTITGVLYRGDNQSKYSQKNDPTIGVHRNVKPEEFALIDTLANEEEAGKFMLHMVDMEVDRRQVLPTIPTMEEATTQFKISPERHGAYEGVWKLASFLGVLSNTAVWLYF